MQTISLITTCKGRLHHLKQTLPMMLAQQPDEIIVVDYGCPDGVGDWAEINYPMVRVVRVSDDPFFHAARARNIGASHASSSWFCFIDADIKIHSGWLNWLRQNMRSNFFYRAGMVEGKRDSEIFGTFIIHRDDFESLGGYDEAFRGWGTEDMDIYERLVWFGIEESAYPPVFVEAIHHDDSERVAFHEIRDKKIQNRINRIYMDFKEKLFSRFGVKNITIDVRLSCLEQIKRQIIGRNGKDEVRYPLKPIILNKVMLNEQLMLHQTIILSWKRRYVFCGPTELHISVRV